jgi:steroid 5-alpha reductase family enzyme
MGPALQSTLGGSILVGNLAGILVLAVGLWIASVRLRDVSIVDAWWPVFFVWVGWHTALRTGLTPGKTLLMTLVSLWALRLGAHLAIRNHGKPEDARYAAFRQHFGASRYWWFSFFQVFLLQGVLAFLISAPLQVAGSAQGPDPVTDLDLLATLVFYTGFFFEAVADQQLQRFRRVRKPGQVLDKGLWRYSRHPNYFGEALLWWGLGLFALDVPYGWLALGGPAILTWLLLRVSGVAMLDELLRRTKPGYDDYIHRTSAFLPRRPRKQ